MSLSVSQDSSLLPYFQAVAPHEDMTSFSYSEIMIPISFCGYGGQKLVSLFEDILNIHETGNP